MAMPRSLAPLLLLLSIFVFTAHASRSRAATGGDSLQKSNPAGPRQEALLAFQNLVKEGQALLVESQREVAESKDDDEVIKYCLTVLDDNLKAYTGPLSKLAPEQSDAKFGEARDMLTLLFKFPSITGVSCSEKERSAKPIVNKILKFEVKLQEILNLMSNAQPAAPPPSSSEHVHVKVEA